MRRRFDTSHGIIIIAPIAASGDNAAWLTPVEVAHLATLTSPTRRDEWSTWRAAAHRELGPGTTIAYDALGAPVITYQKTGEVVNCGDGTHDGDETRRETRGDSRNGIGRQKSCAGGGSGQGMDNPDDGRWEYLSVSHTGGCLALMFSHRPCAVDIEWATRDFSRAASRYMTARELAAGFSASVGAGSDFKALVWCAKETLFKFARRTGVDFRNDMYVEGIESVEDTKTGEGFDGAESTEDTKGGGRTGIISASMRDSSGAWQPHTIHYIKTGELLITYME